MKGVKLPDSLRVSAMKGIFHLVVLVALGEIPAPFNT